ncbi:MAG: hypothetical protein V4857_02045 [Pseudomonadota bacterium]
MNLFLLKILILGEVRLRMRRLSTVVTLVAVAAIGWAMIPDPTTSTNALISIDDMRVLYTSSAMALGSACFGGTLFSLAGFYLVRGRMSEDIRSGTGSVICATPVGNIAFLVGRWMGGVAYLGALVLAFMGTMMVCHALRGEGPIEPLIYLQTYLVVLLPMVLFTASCAILFDSYPLLMGKAGDALYFFMMLAQLMIMAIVEKHAKEGFHPLLLVDFSGMAATFFNLATHFSTTNLSVGASPFDPKLAPITLPATVWSVQIMLTRLASCAIALLPLLPAALLFHRFSPDRVKVSRASVWRSPLAILNGWCQPLARLAQPLFRGAAVLPGLAGRIAAELALTLAANPSAIAVLIIVCGASLLAPSAKLGVVVMGGVMFWGALVCAISTRDYDADMEALSGAVPGGAGRRYLGQLGATIALGLMIMGPIALRWSLGEPLRAAAVVAGVFALGALASMFGRLSRTSRTFLALFMFACYVVLNGKQQPMLDMVGFSGATNMQALVTQLVVGAAAVLVGYAYNRHQAR